MVERQGVDVPSGLCRALSDDQYDQLFRSTIIHEKPLINALGENYKDILSVMLSP